MWTFSLPKLIRPYFVNHPELMGKLCRAAFETVQEMMAEAAVGSEGFSTGMVAVLANSGDLLNRHPHIHALVPRGGWDGHGFWVPVPYLDQNLAERLFRKKALGFLQKDGFLSEERVQLLLSWNHNSGFSIDDSVRIQAEDSQALERLARYMVRPPLSLERMRYEVGDNEVVYERKRSNGKPGAEERFDPLDFLARLISLIPQPKLHNIRYLGHYSNVSRGRRKKGKDQQISEPRPLPNDGLSDAQRRARRKAWARLIKRVFEIDPLVCLNCGGEMRIVSVILEHKVIKKILGHLARKGIEPGRGPPEQPASSSPAPF
jgi:hypothetical protein